MEFEWIRQFYVQGRHHYDCHMWWHGPMQELVTCWQALHERTQKTFEVLHDAAGNFDDGACGTCCEIGLIDCVDVLSKN